MNTLATFYCEQRDMLARQIDAWLQWDAAALAGVEIVVVDDCSLATPAAKMLRGTGLPVRVLRHTVSIPWNSAGVRNLAMSQARGAVVLLADLDQVLEADAALVFAGVDIPAGAFAQPARVDEDGRAIAQPHPHLQAMRPADFWAMGGYDEDWLGYEGDNLMVPRRAAALMACGDAGIVLRQYADGGTRRWPRSGRYNARMRGGMDYDRAMRSPDVRPRNPLRTPFEEVAL